MVDTVDNAWHTPDAELPRAGLGLTPAGSTRALLAGLDDLRVDAVDVGHGLAATLAIASHAAQGPDGAVGEVLARGARPVALLESLCLGPLDDPGSAHELPALVAGVADPGNRLGVPTVGGEMAFDRTYAGTPVVNAVCVGFLRRGDVPPATAAEAGDRVLLVGGAVRSRGLIEACVDLVGAGVAVALRGVGADGLGGALAGIGASAGVGLRVELSRVAASGSAADPEEIVASAGRGCLVALVRPAHVERFREMCATWGVPTADLGEAVDGDRLLVDHEGARVIDIDLRTLATPPDEGPGPVRPSWIDEVNARPAEHLPRAVSGDELRAQVLRLAGSTGLGDRSWVTDQFDRYVRGDTVLAQPEDAGLVRIDEESRLGLAAAVAGAGRFALLNPYLGAQLALCEAHRSVASTGATPVAVTPCLNVGSPDDPDVLWQLHEAALGLADACRALGLPIVGGDLGLGHHVDGRNILPTPMVGALGVIDEVADRTPMGFAYPGDAVVLLGATKEELSGSSWADAVHDHLGGMPPMPDLDAERALAAVLVGAASRRLLTSAHSLAAGGLAQALAESCLRGNLGVALTLPDGDPAVHLFSESPARALVSLPGATFGTLEALCAEHGVLVTRLGEVTGAPEIEVCHQFTLGLDELRAHWEAPIRGAMAGR